MAEKRYAIMHIEKYKNKLSMTKSYNHNYRRVKVGFENLDEEVDSFRHIQWDKVHLDRELITDYEGKDYYQVLRERLAELPYYSNHKLRKDAVLGFEIMLTMSAEMVGKINVDEWADANVEWLRKKFGVENVESAMLHLDESTPHIHAFVIPIRDGRLSAKQFINGPKELRALQDDYAAAMEPFGLERGIKAGYAKMEDIHRFQGKINIEMDKIDEIARIQKNALGINEKTESFSERIVPLLKSFAARNIALEAEVERLSSILQNIPKKDKYYESIQNNLKEKQRTDIDVMEESLNWKKLKKTMEEYPDAEVRAFYEKHIDNALKWATNKMEKEERTRNAQQNYKKL